MGGQQASINDIHGWIQIGLRKFPIQSGKKLTFVIFCALRGGQSLLKMRLQK